MTRKAVVWVLGAAIALLGAFFGFNAWSTLRRPIPKLEHPKMEIWADIPGSFYLRNASTLDDVHQLDGEFRIVRRMNQIPEACMSPFLSLFLAFKGSRAEAGDVLFANPGERFNRSDSITAGLPFRRLEFAGFNPSACFVYYRRGERMAPSYCLAVVDSAKNKVAVGEYDRAAKNLEELRRMLVQRRFTDGDGC